MLENLPDAAALRVLIERLWTGHTLGHTSGRAAVLVGAGVSRCGAVTAPGVPPPPLWNDLATVLASDLYGPSGGRGISPLQLAEEYAQYLSRDALNAAIRRVVTNEAYEPSELQKRLLGLPWSDVFTTNYDTLLEHAAQRCGRRYTVVRTPQQLPQADAPRIVKLHGSLPDHTPFIVTEDDYRRYPHTHAPFVSLARTRLVEHALVMLGFSGDDPNFLQWSGWVRDHLSAQAPPLYFVTLGLSLPRRVLLEKRGIAPIDLEPAFPAHEWAHAPGDRYRTALDAFIEALAAGKPTHPLAWPGSTERRNRRNETALPYPATPPRFVLTGKPSKAADLVAPPADARVLECLKAWEAQRAHYPGWHVAPMAVRDTIWRDTEDWYEILWDYVSKTKPPHDLLALRELLWRLRCAYVPLQWDSEAELALAVLLRYNPAPTLFHPPEFPTTPEAEADTTQPPPSSSGHEATLDAPVHVHSPATHPTFNWAELTEAWIDVALAFLETCRQAPDQGQFVAWSEALVPLAQTRAEWQARLAYLRARYWLDQGSWSEAAKIAGDPLWISSLQSFPMGAVWRAGILAETGRTDDALAVARTALDRFHTLLSATPSLQLQSQESWVALVVQTLEKAKTPMGWGDVPDPAWSESITGSEGGALERIREVRALVERTPPAMQAPVFDTPGFDPGNVTTTHQMKRRFTFVDHLPGVAALALREAGGLPLRVGANTLDADLTERAAAFARPFLPWTSYAALLRGAYPKTEEQFSRGRILGFDEEHMALLLQTTLSASQERLGKLEGGDHSVVGHVAGLLGMLSRLTIRASHRASDLLGVALRAAAYSVSLPGGTAIALVDAAKNVIKRVGQTVNDDTLCVHLPGLLALPLPGASAVPHSSRDFAFTLLVRHVTCSALSASEEGSGRERLDRQIIRLLTALREPPVHPDLMGNASAMTAMQKEAASRLLYLYRGGMLSEAQAAQFASAFWSLVEDPSGLPFANDDRLVAEALYSPAPPSGPSTAARIRALLLGRTPVNPGGAAIPGTMLAYLEPLRAVTQDPFEAEPGIVWSRENALQILETISGAWEALEQSLAEAREREREHGIAIVSQAWVLETQANWIAPALADVVLPALDAADVEARDRVAEITNGLMEAGLPVALCMPHLARLGHDAQRAHALIVRYLTSSDADFVEQGSEAVVLWCMLYAQGRFPSSTALPPPETLAADLISTVLWGSGNQTSGAVFALARLLRYAPSVVPPTFHDRLLQVFMRLADLTEGLVPEESWAMPTLPEYSTGEGLLPMAVAALAGALTHWSTFYGLTLDKRAQAWLGRAAQRFGPVLHRRAASFAAES